MAKLEGISGMQMGDGLGGKIALSIQKGLLRILSNSTISYLTATAANPSNAHSGTLTYYVPEGVQTFDYGAAGLATPFQDLETGLISFNMDTRRSIKYEYETFDISRLDEQGAIIAQATTSAAMAILNDMNAHFITFLSGPAVPTTQEIVLTQLGSTEDMTDATMIAGRNDINRIQRALIEMSKVYDRKQLGVNKDQFLVLLDGIADLNIRSSFWNVFGGIDYALADNIAGTRLGNFTYLIDEMLNNTIAAGASFSLDKNFDSSNVLGFILHNEAVAMPFNLQEMGVIKNPENLNIRTIIKYQFGIGLLRPTLIRRLVKVLTPITTNSKK